MLVTVEGEGSWGGGGPELCACLLNVDLIGTVCMDVRTDHEVVNECCSLEDHVTSDVVRWSSHGVDGCGGGSEYTTGSVAVDRTRRCHRVVELRVAAVSLRGHLKS